MKQNKLAKAEKKKRNQVYSTLIQEIQFSIKQQQQQNWPLDLVIASFTTSRTVHNIYFIVLSSKRAFKKMNHGFLSISG